MTDLEGRGDGGRFSFSEIQAYLSNGIYPQGLAKSGMSVMRRRAKYFRIHQNDLYYIRGGILSNAFFLFLIVVLCLYINFINLAISY